MQVETTHEGAEPTFGNYFVSAYPPFGCWSPAALAALPGHLARAPDAVPLGLYVHVPFCVERCRYCYYLSHDDRDQERGHYVEALGRELDLWLEHALLAGRAPEFVYFGGGTPSSLSVREIERLFATLRARLPLERVREITFECAPRTLTEAKVLALREAGVDRISLGVQQLDDAVLARNGRVHGVADVLRAWELCEGAGFRVRNLDLIVGLLGQSDESFDEGLERVLALGPESVTLYLLEIPRNTPLFRELEQPGSPAPPSWEEKRARLVRGFERLAAAGWVARSAYTAVHPPAPRAFVYQDELYAGADLLGIGTSAFSYLGGAHVQNTARIARWFEGLAEGRLPLQRAYLLDERERLVRELVLQLKLLDVPLAPLRARHGRDLLPEWEEPLARFAAEGWLERSPDRLVVTAQGAARVDRFLTELYLPEHRVERSGAPRPS